MAACCLIVVGVFQVALAMGAPLGQAAWGGQHAVLPSSLRTGSAVAALYLFGAAAVMLARTGWSGLGMPSWLIRYGPWVLAVQLVLNTAGNLASSSVWERYMMGAISAVLALLCLFVARMPVVGPPSRRR